MGEKYEVRWSINNACPFSESKWTNSLFTAVVAFVKAVVCGNTHAELIMHEWKDCPSSCQDFEFCPKKVVG